jgi:hypothetical protein
VNTYEISYTAPVSSQDGKSNPFTNEARDGYGDDSGLDNTARAQHEQDEADLLRSPARGQVSLYSVQRLEDTPALSSEGDI